MPGMAMNSLRVLRPSPSLNWVSTSKGLLNRISRGSAGGALATRRGAGLAAGRGLGAERGGRDMPGQKTGIRKQETGKRGRQGNRDPPRTITQPDGADLRTPGGYAPRVVLAARGKPMSTSESVLDTFTGWAATAPRAPLVPHSFDPGPLGAEEVEVRVEYCGICHSDQSMIDNEWGNARYPFIPGHEVVGTIARLGDQVRGLKLGQRVGIGWYKGSCMHCHSCMEGSHPLCGTVKPTIVGSNCGFADRLRAHWAWAIPLPEALDPSLAGPLFCAGSTVFAPLLELGVKPTDRVGVVGIGGLGHLALRFLNAWGCEVTAFTSSLSKQDEANRLGAHRVLASTYPEALKA